MSYSGNFIDKAIIQNDSGYCKIDEYGTTQCSHGLTTTGSIQVGGGNMLFGIAYEADLGFYPQYGTNIPGKDLNIYAQQGTGTGTGGDIKIKTSVGGSSGSTINPVSTKMIIKDDGKVGIGTTAPTSKLEIKSTDEIARFTGSGNNSYIRFISNSNTNRGYFGYYNGNIELSSSNHIAFWPTGNVGIGTALPLAKLHVNGEIKVDTNVKIQYGNKWSLWASNDALYFGHTDSTYGWVKAMWKDGAFFTPSDNRLKHNETPILNAIDTIQKLNPLNYDMTTEFLDEDFNGDLDELGKSYTKQCGFIAQDVMNIPELADCVREGSETEPYTLNYSKIWVYAVKAIQEQQETINELKSRIEALENS